MFPFHNYQYIRLNDKKDIPERAWRYLYTEINNKGSTRDFYRDCWNNIQIESN
jgi:hypothetical protein